MMWNTISNDKSAIEQNYIGDRCLLFLIAIKENTLLHEIIYMILVAGNFLNTVSVCLAYCDTNVIYWSSVYTACYIRMLFMNCV